MQINERVKKVRELFCSDSNSEFASILGVKVQYASNICNSKNVGNGILDNIIEKFPKINPAWLKMGIEPMLLNQEEKLNVANDDPEIPYGGCINCQKKQRLIDQLIGENNVLREQLNLPIPERNKKVS